MTQTEKDAKWIKAERTKIIKQINAINSIIAEQTLLPDHAVKYEFALELGTIGGLQLRIYNKGECEPIAKLEIWNLDYYLMGSSLYLHKESMLEGIKDLTGQLQKIKALAKKYAKLNCN